MANRREVWNLHQLAQAYSVRPSTVIGLDDLWSAYQFDLAVLRLAQYVDAGLAKKQSIEALLGVPAAERKWSDPRTLVRGEIPRVRINESGIW